MLDRMPRTAQNKAQLGSSDMGIVDRKRLNETRFFSHCFLGCILSFFNLGIVSIALLDVFLSSLGLVYMGHWTKLFLADSLILFSGKFTRAGFFSARLVILRAP